MKLYTSKLAPNPRRVHIFIAEKGLDIPRIEVDIMSGEHRSDEFRAINPASTVPVLVLDDGTAIAETVAICRYLEELNPEPSLMGATPLERAQIEMWQRRVEFMLLYPLAQSIRHGVPALAALESPQVAEWAPVAREKAIKAMYWLDEQLDGRPFIAGDKFSIADITALCSIDFGRVSKLAIPDDAENLKRWKAEVSGRPSAKA